ncbi:MAG: AbrB family transcriptional regulator [Thiotrichales bacterium]|nr:AbrB family transcriptional regulator [Thiotrichales bacterium]
MSEGPGPAPLATRLGRTLVIGTAGGALFAWVNLPLAWMLGAMVATTVASLGGARLYVPGPMRSIMVAIIGVLLGASFTPEVLDKARDWPLSIGGLLLHLSILVGVLFFYFHRIVGLDAPTAYFSATPGGLAEMVITGSAMGADDRTIALVHTARVLLVVLTIPLWYRYMTGVVTTPSSIGPSIGAIGFIDVVVLAACAVVGVVAGRLIRLPAYRLSGPLLASAVLHAAGLNESAPPWEVVAVAQVIVGSAIGARFTGVSVLRVLRLTAAAVVSTVVMLVATVAFALVLAPATGIDWRSIVLAYAPGGLAEMSLIALSLGIETAFVATHHVVRIGLIVVVAPLVFARFGSPGRRDR